MRNVLCVMFNHSLSNNDAGIVAVINVIVASHVIAVYSSIIHDVAIATIVHGRLYVAIYRH